MIQNDVLANRLDLSHAPAGSEAVTDSVEIEKPSVVQCRVTLLAKQLGLMSLTKCFGWVVGTAQPFIFPKFCIKNLMPVNLRAIQKTYISYHLPLLPKNVYLRSGLVVPIIEEIEFRLLIQDVLFKKIPKIVLEKVSPKHAHLVDSKVAKMARILFSSTIFTVMHYSQEYKDVCERNNFSLITHFFSGVFYGCVLEEVSDISYPIFLHMANNIFWLTRAALR